MHESPHTVAGSVVEVVRPVAVRQLAAGFATVAAAAAASGLASSATTVRRGQSEFSAAEVVTTLAWGKHVNPPPGDGYIDTSATWGGPLVLAVVLLLAAALAALVAARTDERGGWGRGAQLLAVAGAALLLGVLAVVVAFGVVAVHTGNYDVSTQSVDTRWGPVPALLGLATVLAAAAAVTVRRGRATVLATVRVPS